MTSPQVQCSAPLQEASDRASARPIGSIPDRPSPGTASTCVVCGAPRRYRRQLCRPCWERFNAKGLEMPPRESRAEPIENYLGRVLARLPRAKLARVVSLALTGNEGA